MHYSLLSVTSFIGRLLTREERIRNTLDVENERTAGKHPLLRRVGRLELSGKHIRFVSVGRHVHGALVNAFFFFAFDNHLCSAVDQGHDRELLLGDGLFHLSRVLVPGCTFELEPEHEGTIIHTLEHVWNFGVPMESLLDVSLNEKLVETLASLLGADLFDRSEE